VSWGFSLSGFDHRVGNGVASPGAFHDGFTAKLPVMVRQRHASEIIPERHAVEYAMLRHRVLEFINVVGESGTSIVYRFGVVGHGSAWVRDGGMSASEIGDCSVILNVGPSKLQAIFLPPANPLVFFRILRNILSP